MANVNVKDWAQQRGYKSVNYDPKTKKISVDGIVFGEPTVEKGVAKMDEFRLDTIYNQQKVDAATGETKANRQKYMDTVNKGYTPSVFKYDRNTDSGYQAALSASKANLNKSLSQNRWAMSGTGNARSSVALERANQLIGDENRRIETEVVPALEDRAFNRFVQSENTNRAQWQDQVKALADAYNMTNDEMKLLTGNLNQSKTQSQTQSNWNSDYNRMVNRDKTDDENTDLDRISNEKQAAATLAAQAASEKARLEFEKQKAAAADAAEKARLAWEKEQAKKAEEIALKTPSSTGGGSGGISGSSGGGSTKAGPAVKADSVAGINTLISGNKSFFETNQLTKAVTVNKAALPQITSIIKESRLPYWEKKQLYSMYGIQSGINQIDADTNLKRVKANPQEFLNGLIGAFEKGQIDENTFYRRVTHYGLLPLLTGK